MSVRCVDEATGEIATVERVHWNCTPPQGARRKDLQRAIFNDFSSRWEFRAPEGSIEIGTDDYRYEHSETTVQAGPGMNEVELRLSRTTGVLLILRDENAEVPWDHDQIPEIVTVEGSGSYSGWGRFEGRFMFRTDGPGLFKLTLDEIPGYEPILEQTVRLEQGTILEHLIHLKRKF